MRQINEVSNLSSFLFSLTLIVSRTAKKIQTEFSSFNTSTLRFLVLVTIMLLQENITL